MIVYAVNIHSGGGKVLLDELLKEQPLGAVEAAFLDQRYEPPKPAPNRSTFLTFFSKNRLWGRLWAEVQLHRFLAFERKRLGHTPLLFFGNIPPFFKPQIRSILYLQNCFLTRQVPLPNDTLREKLRNWIESQLLRFFSKNVDEIWVQTDWMVALTQKYLPGKTILKKMFLPSFPEVEPEQNALPFNFLFVGSASLNKRLDFFLKTLQILDEQVPGKSLSIALILEHSQTGWSPPAFKNIEVSVQIGLPYLEVLKLYTRSKALVATSLYESLCLPIYEAHHYGCHVIVPRTGYAENLPFQATMYDTFSAEDLAQKMLNHTLN